MENSHKTKIVELIKEEAKQLGSAAKVAIKCEVSKATISQMTNKKWKNIADDLWAHIGNTLGFSLKKNWEICTNTINYKMITNTLEKAKTESIFTAIASPAGSGKTATLKNYTKEKQNNTFYLQCGEWTKRELCINLSKSLGIGYKTYTRINLMLEQIVKTLKQMEKQELLIIIDEADKLRPAALRTLIPLYNYLEDKIGIVIAGTEHLKKRIKQGVARRDVGYDEIDSRFGRSYINLIGAIKQDVANICKNNLITNEEEIKRIWNACEPTATTVSNRTIKVVKDYRRIKRLIKEKQYNRK